MHFQRETRVTPGLSARTSLQEAELVAMEAFSFLAADSIRLNRFLSLTGLGPGNLGAIAMSAGFLSCVLDYFNQDEPLLLAFAAESGRNPTDIVASRNAFSGSRGEEPS